MLVTGQRWVLVTGTCGCFLLTPILCPFPHNTFPGCGLPLHISSRLPSWSFLAFFRNMYRGNGLRLLWWVRNATVLLGIVFLGCFFILVGIGAEAPPVLVEEFPGTGQSYDGTNHIHLSTFTPSRENQIFWLDYRLSTGIRGLLEEEVESGKILEIELDLTLQVRDENKSANHVPSLHEAVQSSHGC